MQGKGPTTYQDLNRGVDNLRPPPPPKAAVLVQDSTGTSHTCCLNAHPKPCQFVMSPQAVICEPLLALRGSMKLNKISSSQEFTALVLPHHYHYGGEIWKYCIGREGCQKKIILITCIKSWKYTYKLAIGNFPYCKFKWGVATLS